MANDEDEAAIVARIGEQLDTLPMVTRAVFLLHRIDDLGYDEIAWRFGIGTKAVERHMARALHTIAWGRRRWWRRWWRMGSGNDPS